MDRKLIASQLFSFSHTTLRARVCGSP